MRINKKSQDGLLLVLYLCRAGRATVKTISENLDLPYHALASIACILNRKKVVKALRGHGGGFEVAGDPTVRDVLAALGSVRPLTQHEMDVHSLGAVENRALAQFARTFSVGIEALLNQPVRNVSKALVVHELQRMSNASEAVAN